MKAHPLYKGLLYPESLQLFNSRYHLLLLLIQFFHPVTNLLPLLSHSQAHACLLPDSRYLINKPMKLKSKGCMFL